jgi:hypothetical protein
MFKFHIIVHYWNRIILAVLLLRHNDIFSKFKKCRRYDGYYGTHSSIKQLMSSYNVFLHVKWLHKLRSVIILSVCLAV